MKKPSLSRFGTSIVLCALGSIACSLQDFDALGAGSQYNTGGFAPGTGGSSSDGGDSSSALGGTQPITNTGGNANLGGRTGVGGRTGTGGSPATGGATNIGGASTLMNPSFELGSSGWIVDPAAELGFPNSAYSVFVQGPVGSATVHQGSFQISVYNGVKTYQIKIYQVLNGLSDGKYAFSGWFARGAMTSAYVYATGCGGPELAHAQIPPSDAWTMVSVAGIDVVGGRCEVGFYVEGSGTDWLTADDFAFASEGDAG